MAAIPRVWLYSSSAPFAAHLQRGGGIVRELDTSSKLPKFAMLGVFVGARFLGHVLVNERRRMSPLDIAVLIPQRIDLAALFLV